MNNATKIIFALRVASIMFILYTQKRQIEIMQAEQAVLRSMFTVKVDYLNHLSGRHEYAETLREELERFEREAGVK